KRQVRPERAWGAGVVWRAAPALLVFPRVAGTPESTLAPMDRGEALLELAPNVLLTEPHSSQAHLDALAGLVERSECWRLATGTDLGGAVRVLTELMGGDAPRPEPSPPTPSPAPSHPPHRERGTRLEISCLSPSSPGEGGWEGAGEEGRGDEDLGRGRSDGEGAAP
ncbi:MAG: hypothetical protein JF630_05565, partial [Geodermatophilales bacterium]|nr:hypothetical protein [Geodermatophilales bacterium]